MDEYYLSRFINAEAEKAGPAEIDKMSTNQTTRTIITKPKPARSKAHKSLTIDEYYLSRFINAEAEKAGPAKIDKTKCLQTKQPEQ